MRLELRCGADVNAQDDYGSTPLHLAARWNENPAVAEALLDAGADPNAEDEAGRTPLVLASRWDANAAVIPPLLDAGADPVPALCTEADLTTKEDWLSGDFWRAATIARVRLELRCGADVNAQGDYGETPLHLAAEWNDNPAVLQALLDQGADVNARRPPQEGRTPLHLAAMSGNPSGIAALIEGGAEIEARAFPGEGGGPCGSPDKVTALGFAVGWGPAANASALIDAGANIDGDIMYWAAACSGPDNLQVLIDAGADVDYMLFRAVAVGDPANIGVLLAAGADVNAQGDDYGSTPLHGAAWNDNPAVVQALLDAGADTEARDDVGRTPLHVAASISELYHPPWYGSIEGLIALIEAGADVEALDDEGQAPLHVATLHPEPWGQPSSQTKIGVLLAAGADIEARDWRGRTPLHVAASMRYDAPTLIALIEAGADVEALDDEGQTPLHVAALHPEAQPGQPVSQTKIGVLLAAGADIEARDWRGRTPLDLAAGASGHSDFMKKLLDSGAVVDGVITTSTGWRIIVDTGVGAATRDGRTVVLFADQEKLSDGDSEPQGSWNRMLSAVGSTVSIGTSYYYEGGAHPSYGTTWTTIDLETGEPSSLPVIFPEDEILAALLADPIVREAYRGDGEPSSLSELIEYLDGECAMRFSSDMLTDFAFHHVRGNRVAVRIGLTHGCEVMRGNFTQIGLYLDIPPVLSEAFRWANVDGRLMETLDDR